MVVANELMDVLDKVVQGWSIDLVESDSKIKQKRVGFSERGGQHFEAWLVSDDQEKTANLSCSSETPISPDEVRLMRKVASVFNADLQVVGNVAVAQDLWRALGETRFLRAAARLSTFSTEPLLRWMSAFEAATRQTYEGNQFTGSVILATNLLNFRQHARERFHPFSQDLRFEQALLKEKWLKPFLQEGEFALVSTSHRGRVSGFVDTSVAWRRAHVHAPTDTLDGLYGYLRPGTSILTAPPTGDIRFVLSNGITFVKSQGEWRYPTWRILTEILDRRLGTEIAGHALRLVVSASYMRRGSLYVFLDDGVNPSDVVPDHTRPDRVASLLRSTLAGGFISPQAQRRILQAASRIDGAIIFDHRGQILDVASMVAEPQQTALASVGLASLVRFAGARSTAAWNASVRGLAIKVSDDGPVDAYEYGNLVFHSG
jgi:hypothetical protein